MPEPIERGQSPPPERQSNKQMGEPASGKGTDDASHKEESNKSAIEVCTMAPKIRTSRN